MKTEILGGGSFKNKVWVDEIKSQLAPEVLADANYYTDWDSSNDARVDFNTEVAKVQQKVGDEPFDMIAKSVGSLVGLTVIAKNPSQLRKLIICGIPLKDFSAEEIDMRYKILESLPVENVIVFQNEFDNHGSFEDAKKFMAKINPAIKVVKMTGEFSSTHNYPYPNEFKAFLLG